MVQNSDNLNELLNPKYFFWNKLCRKQFLNLIIISFPLFLSGGLLLHHGINIESKVLLTPLNYNINENVCYVCTILYLFKAVA